MKKKEKILLIAGIAAFVAVIAVTAWVFPTLRDQYDKNQIVSEDKDDKTSSEAEKTTSFEDEISEVPEAENNAPDSSQSGTSSDAGSGKKNDTSSGSGKKNDTSSGSGSAGSSSGNSSKSNDTSSSDAPSAPQQPNINYATDFTVVDKNGNKVKLSDMRGKPVVVNIWASWCPPCVNELPHFEKLSKEYAGKVDFMMVDLVGARGETKETALNFVDQQGYTFPIYFDSLSSAASAYSINSIPMTLFINADGSLYAQRIGGMTESDLRQNIKAIVGE